MRMNGFFSVLAALVATPAAFAGTITVPTDYPTIQAAINASVNGDTIVVRKGTYNENINFLGKQIILDGKDCKITNIVGVGGGPVVTMAGGETAATVIKQFSIKGGTGKLIGTKTYGGGMYIAGGADPTIEETCIGFNTADYGAGVFVDVGSDPTFTDCLIVNNNTSLSGTGGGLYISGNATLDDNRIAENNAVNGTGGGVYLLNSNSTLTNNEIDSNLSYYGGGVHVNGGSPTLTNNIFETNTVLNNPTNGEGAGLAIVGKAKPFVTGNDFHGNTAHSGAGLYVYDASPKIVTNIVHDNTAFLNYLGSLGFGGGISMGKGGGSVELNEFYYNIAANGGGLSTRSSTTSLLTGNIIDHNDTGTAGLGGGIYSKDSTSTVLGNTIAANNANVGGGVHVAKGKGAPTIDTSIIFFNTATSNKSYYDGTGVMMIIFSDVEAASVGGSSLSIDPAFVDVALRNFRLGATSPVVDAGNFGYTGTSSDVYGAARVNGGRVDMGAAEQ